MNVIGTIRYFTRNLISKNDFHFQATFTCDVLSAVAVRPVGVVGGNGNFYRLKNENLYFFCAGVHFERPPVSDRNRIAS